MDWLQWSIWQVHTAHDQLTVAGGMALTVAGQSRTFTAFPSILAEVKLW